MNATKYAIYILVALLVTYGKVNAQVITDPFVDYFGRVPYSAEDSVLSFEVDFGEKKEVLFISLTTRLNGKAGNIWKPYLHKADGYEPLESITLREDILAFATAQGLEGNALLTYGPGGAGVGTLRAIQITDGKVVEINLGEIEPMSKDKDLYQKLFLTESTHVSVDENALSDVLAMHPPLIPADEDVKARPPVNEKRRTHPPANPKRDEQSYLDTTEGPANVADANKWILYSICGIIVALVGWTVISRNRRAG